MQGAPARRAPSATSRARPAPAAGSASASHSRTPRRRRARRRSPRSPLDRASARVACPDVESAVAVGRVRRAQVHALARLAWSSGSKPASPPASRGAPASGHRHRSTCRAAAIGAGGAELDDSAVPRVRTRRALRRRRRRGGPTRRRRGDQVGLLIVRRRNLLARAARPPPRVQLVTHRCHRGLATRVSSAVTLRPPARARARAPSHFPNLR